MVPLFDPIHCNNLYILILTSQKVLSILGAPAFTCNYLCLFFNPYTYNVYVVTYFCQHLAKNDVWPDVLHHANRRQSDKSIYRINWQDIMIVWLVFKLNRTTFTTVCSRRGRVLHCSHTQFLDHVSKTWSRFWYFC